MPGGCATLVVLSWHLGQSIRAAGEVLADADVVVKPVVCRFASNSAPFSCARVELVHVKDATVAIRAAVSGICVDRSEMFIS